MKDSFFLKCEKIVSSKNLDLTKDPPVLYPHSESILCDIIRKIHSEKLPVRILGGGTCPFPESDSSKVQVSTKELNTIKEINIDDFIMRVQAGVIVDDAASAAERFGLYMPLDITSGDRATIGGAYMTGAVGPSMTGYGAFHGSVIGVHCITAEGNAVTFGGRTAKNVTGYDVTRFLSGTLGLYALATELILKVYTFPESRSMGVARFSRRSKPFDAVTTIVSSCENVKRFELFANAGLGGEIIIGTGFEGMKSFVKKNINLVKEIMNNARADDFHVRNYYKFMTRRRKAAIRMVGQDFYTITVPPASSGFFLERIKTVSPEIPVIAHPKIGRFHLVCHDVDQMKKLNKSALALGGKLPVMWGYANTKGIADFFTKPELGIARSLKREMDPLGIFNPHIRF